MRCPHCNAWSELLETRKRKTTGLVCRRYECANLHRFTTADGVVVRIDIKRRPPGRPSKENQE